MNENLMQALEMLGQGMLGIFVVLVAAMNFKVVQQLMQKLGGKK